MKHLIFGVLFTALVFSFVARADQPYLNSATTALATRACAFNGVHAKTVSVTSSTAASSTLAQGMVRMVCTQDVHFYQGAAGVTGPTAATTDSMLVAKSAEYVYNPGNNKIAFIRDSADGTCYVTECQ